MMSGDMSEWRGRGRRRVGQRGGAFGSLVKFLALLGVLLAVDGVLTTRALQGTWRMDMPEGVDAHLHALLFAANQNKQGAKAGIFGGALRDSLTRGISKLGGSLMTATAENVRMKVEGRTFALQATEAEAATLMTMMSAVARPGSEPVQCDRGSILAAFPLAQITCHNAGEDEALLFIMRGWPGERANLFPLPVGEQEIKDRAQKLQQQLGQGGGAEAPSPEVIEAMRELFTLRFVKVP